MPKRESAFKGKAVSWLAIFFMILGGCSNDDSVTDATTEQRASRAGSASDSEAARENIMKTDIYVRDGSAEEALRKLTSYIEESKRLGFISFESSAVGEYRSALRSAEDMLESRGLFEGLDAEKRRAIILETGATELGCLLNALRSSAKLGHEAIEIIEGIEIISSESSSTSRTPVSGSGGRSEETTSELEINLDGGLAEVRYVGYSMERDGGKSAGSVRSAHSYRVNDFDEVTGAARTRVVSGDTACVLLLRMEN